MLGAQFAVETIVVVKYLCFNTSLFWELTNLVWTTLLKNEYKLFVLTIL